MPKNKNGELGLSVNAKIFVKQKHVSNFDRERAATRAAMFCLWVPENLEGGADELLTKVKRCSFNKLQTLLIYNHTNAILLKNPAGVQTHRYRDRCQSLSILFLLQVKIQIYKYNINTILNQSV